MILPHPPYQGHRPYPVFSGPLVACSEQGPRLCLLRGLTEGASGGELGQASGAGTQRAISGVTGPWRKNQIRSQEAEPRPEVRRKQARLPSAGRRGRQMESLWEPGGEGGVQPRGPGHASSNAEGLQE